MTECLKQLLCDPSTPQPTKLRVNELKQYIEWEGCTAIMKLHEKSHGLAKKIYDALNENDTVNQLVALLPPESYHVTLRGLRERFKCQNGSLPGGLLLVTKNLIFLDIFLYLLIHD